jgi:hypothetical protein
VVVAHREERRGEVVVDGRKRRGKLGFGVVLEGG